MKGVINHTLQGQTDFLTLYIQYILHMCWNEAIILLQELALDRTVVTEEATANGFEYCASA